MADRLYSKAFKFMVKFPDGIEPPDGYKPPDEYDDYIGVAEPTTASRATFSACQSSSRCRRR